MWIYLVLIAVVVLFGVGVVLWNRRRSRAVGEASTYAGARSCRPTAAIGLTRRTGTAVLERPADDAAEVEQEARA